MKDPFSSGMPARWIRADFHLHTQADREFEYHGNTDYYSSSYVDALEKAKIRLGVITNHNKFDYKEFKTLEKIARKKSITLLPGIELSVGEGASGIHMLVVFSNEWIVDGSDYINPFLSNVFEGKTATQYEQENECTRHGILSVIQKLENQNRDFFLIFAHVEEDKGLWKELKGSRLIELGKDESFRSRTLGFQKVRTYNMQEKGKVCRTKVKNWLGDFYPAELEGSDPKSLDQIGQGKQIYLKLGELSFDAVKFALSDPSSRVATEPRRHSGAYIQSVCFEGGILDGKTLQFSPELTTLIGIRGSGKSSILESIRYALNLSHDEKAEDSEYKKSLVRHTLASGGKVTVTGFDSYGQKFEVSRIFGEAPSIYIEGKLEPGVSIQETVLGRPVYFGQKDLSSTGDEIDTEIFRKLSNGESYSFHKKAQEQASYVKSAVELWRKLNNLTEKKTYYQAQLDDANFRLEKFSEYGIADKLKRKIGFQKDASVLAYQRELIQQFVSSLNSLVAEHEDELRNASGYRSTENPRFFSNYHDEFSLILKKLDQLKQMETEIQHILKRIDVKNREFESIQKGQVDEFAQAERKLVDALKQTGAINIHPDEFLAQQRRKTEAEQMLSALKKQESQQSAIYENLVSEVEKLDALWVSEFNTIKSEVDRLNSINSDLKIKVEFKGDKEAAVNFMKQIFRGTRIRETTLQEIIKSHENFSDILHNLKEVKSKASDPELFEKTFLRNLSDFLTWQAPNRFVVSYRGKELKYHSLGQRASALLICILTQNKNEIIIIDQPEDDLDNQTIYESIIKIVRQMKPRVQFIFATHNANFPVLGDAEQVHACRSEGGAITVLSGSVDSNYTQKAIIDIMEGGQEAFSRRKEIYNLWKPQS